MKRLFKFNNLEQVEKLVDVVNAQHYNIIIDKENSLLLIDEELYNFNQTIMELMEIIRKNESIQKCFDSWFDGRDRIHNMPIFINDKPSLPGWSLDGDSIENAIIIDYTIQEIKINQESLKTKDNPNNLGIEEINSAYIVTNELQEAKYEYRKISKFLQLFKVYYAQKNNMNIDKIDIKFINYGKTELVYVLTDSSNNQYTLLVKQPALKIGTVLKESHNLRELNEVDDHVIAPIDYFSIYDQELYVTPYLYQARCIASDLTWGVYVPEPIYRFESFTKEQEEYINMCMIAKLISLYNYKKEEGIANCKLGGGDFILEKGWEKLKLTTENILNKLYLIAARDKISCSLDEYIEIIKKEFGRRRHFKNQ